jgi:hypothetical protein
MMTTPSCDGRRAFASAARRRYTLPELDDGSTSLAHYPGRPPVEVGFKRFWDQKDLRGAPSAPAARRWPDFPDLLSSVSVSEYELDPRETYRGASRWRASLHRIAVLAFHS